MSARSTHDSGVAGLGPRKSTDLFPPDFLRVIAVWSVIPSYLLAGGLIGYGLDYLLHTFPYLTGVGLLIALALAVRDMYRLRHEFEFAPKQDAEGDDEP